MGKDRYIVLDGKKVKVGYYTPEEEDIYLSISEEMWESDRASEINYAKKEEKIKIAKKLIKMKMDIEKISKITGLSKEEIQGL